MLSLSLNAQDKSVGAAYSKKFETQFAKTNTALLAYMTTSCVDPSFDEVVDTFIVEENKMADVANEMPEPKDADPAQLLSWIERSYGLLAVSKDTVNLQNKCLKDHNLKVPNPEFDVFGHHLSKSGE